MGFVKVASVKDLLPGKKIDVKLGGRSILGIGVGGKSILIVNLDGKFYAIGNKCTHLGCKLSDGKIDGETIICHCHGSVFDIKNGKVLKGPAKTPETTYKIKIDGNDIMVDF